MKRWKEISVGGLVVATFVFLGVFAWFMGGFSPFKESNKYRLFFGFAGGIEVGSPVRVSGIKVGKVEAISFLQVPRDLGGEDRASLEVTISVEKKAVGAVREDSKFYVNMAGIIGERYVEISPGGPEAKLLPNGAEVRAVDPPRIDQLLSQGYGLFGRMQKILVENEDTITDFFEQTSLLMKDTNKVLKGKERHRFFSLINNLNDLSEDLKGFSNELKSPEAKKFFQELQTIMGRAYGVDEKNLRKFLQDEGVRARIF